MLSLSAVVTEKRFVQSRDGTRIAYYLMGNPDHLSGEARKQSHAPWVVLANGLGGSHEAWKPLVEYLGDRYRFVTWDYRGLYGSDAPSDPSPQAYDIDRHVEDLFAILGEVGIDEATFCGWSMGVQVSLEAYRTRPELMKRLILLNGTYGKPLDTVVPGPFGKHLVPRALDIVDHFHDRAGQVLRLFADQPETVRVMKRLGMMGETLDEADFSHLVRAFGKLDVRAFTRNLKALGRHDARALLPTIRVPVLVIAGDRDRMTPRELSSQIASEIPDAEILIVRGGTHYTAVEFPELVNLRIERFLAKPAVRKEALRPAS